MAEHDDHQEEFQSVQSGAANTFPKQCSALRKNEHVLLKGHPCKVVEMSTSKTGKHGHAKVHLVGIDIFTGKKYEDICPSTHNMEVPVVKRREYQLTSIPEDGFAGLLDLESYDMREDVRMPEGELGDQIVASFNKDENGIIVSVVSAMGVEMILGFKNMPKD